jgi:hypothetical protein
MMKTVGLSVVALSLACALPARAGTVAGARPAGVFGEVVANAPAAEQPRWAAMLQSFGSKGPVPPIEALVAGLGKMIGAASLEGIDAKRPVALVLLDPRSFPKPLLLVAEVASDKTLATSLQASPEVAVKRQKRVAVMGAADAIAAASA